MNIVPVTRDDALAWIVQHHRHSPPPQGYRAAIAAEHDGRIVGVAILGRPVNKTLDDGWTIEAIRVCTDGTRNANSFLYGAAWRLARALGYRKCITYTLKSESGASLRASGYRVVGEVKARSWDTPSRPRVDKHELQQRFRWEVSA